MVFRVREKEEFIVKIIMKKIIIDIKNKEELQVKMKWKRRWRRI